MARHMGIAFRALGLAVVSCAVAAGAAEPAANQGAAGVPVRLVSAAPAKILYGLNEPVTGRVSVQNLAKERQVVTVRAWLECEIDQADKPQEKVLAVEPEGVAVADFQWPKGLGRYGHALKAEALIGGNVVGRAEDYFNVCDNYWNVSLIAAVGFIWPQFDNFKPRPDTKWADDMLAAFRRDYFNGFEKFFWAPDDFLDLTPRQEIWWSGQARYLETKAGLKALMDKAHAQGMKAVTYAKLTGGGPTGAEMARRHPEWVWQSNGVLSVDRNAKQLAEWDITGEKHWGGWVPVNYNMNDPKVVDIGIRALSDSASMFGWDGARWDGNFDVQQEVYDLDGKLVEKLTAEQADERNASNMALAKESIARKHPAFVCGYNWTQGNWQQSVATNPKESVELCRGGGLIMNEYINQAASVQHPLHRWDVYGPSVADDVEAIKALGGYYGPILNSEDNADGRYTNVFAYAAGAHPYYHHRWGAFMTRYGTFCWDNALKRQHDVEKLLSVSGGAWWKHWVFERPRDERRRQLIVHLINPPASPVVGEGKKKEDLPPPLKDIAVRVLPGAAAGWKVVRATRLSPEPLVKEAVPVKGAGGWEMTVPEVAVWTILVIDLER